MTAGTETDTARAKDRLREQVGTVGKDLKDLGGVARDAARETLDDARDRAREAYSEGRRRAESEIERLSRRIQDHPLQSIAIAAGVGALLGVLLTRRH